MDGGIEMPMEKIRRFCLKWMIDEFSLFGSVLREDFRPDSDVDVLVNFKDNAGWDLFDFVDMTEELKEIFGREVDLMEKGAIRNPFRRHSIMTSRKVLYAA
ncbi:MAG TPA: nucleotidyltransferase family protein [Dissulfurispiraceae bacterium]|nr:nucleotidyltransferase family protein [Dissulfurispiraceae bacterium]